MANAAASQSRFRADISLSDTRDLETRILYLSSMGILLMIGLALLVQLLCGAEATRPAHWSFQPVARPPVPAVQNAAWMRNPIDAFVLARLEKEGIAPSPEADRTTLIRRLSLDLIGLPPTPTEVSSFLADSRPDAYERVVDRLLASPHYGEKWARVWLDQARYADSDGFRSDRFRPDAWRYRHWVTEALNRNMPFDQFTTEQIAGDLLPGATVEQRVATGFHRNTLTNREGGTDPEQFRFEQTVDRANTVGTVWLGLTVGCAQCHDHKYDPISQKDYYQLFAFFNNVEEINLDAPLPGELGPYLQSRPEHDRKRQDLLLQFRVPDLQRTWEARILEAAANPGKWLDWDHAFDDLRTALDWGEKILKTQAEKRSARERKLLTDYFLENYHRVITKEQKEELKFDELLRQLRSLDDALPAISEAPVLGPERFPRKNHIHVRGDYRTPGIEVQPGFLSAIPAAESDAEPTRLTLARWLLSPANPLTARVAVNRMWQEFFGRGLAPTSENFGTQGERPSHPELLDWLASEFRASRWDMKRMHRTIVLTASYRQSSHARPDLAAKDPDNRLVARQARFRLPAELIRDSALAASGLLNPEIGGRSIRPPQPAGVGNFSSAVKSGWKTSSGRQQYRRGMYIQLHRTVPYPLLANFDAPNGYGSTCRRGRSNTPLQALNLLNDPVFVEAAQSLAMQIVSAPENAFADRLRLAFQLALARNPAQDESEWLLGYWIGQTALLRKDATATAALYPAELPRSGEQAEAAAWVALGTVLFNLDEFVSRE